MNSNKRLMLNTAILNVRMVIMAICSFLSTRFALSALGIDDFGIFSLVASIVTFISLINSLMLSTSYRYITVSIGKGNELEANKTFNVCLTIHVFIALFSILLLLPLGEWYIYSYINYVGDIHNVITVYRLVVIASFISFIGVPYMGLLTAKENFLVLCGFDILCSFLKLAASILIMYIEQYRLVIYAVVIALTTAFPAFTYYLYCTFRYSTISKWNIVKDPKLYIEMAKFSGWVGYGAIACIGKDQGGQLIVNAFFNTVMNAALGIANTVNSFIKMFVNNITKPIAPQITKSYAAKDFDKTRLLLVTSNKWAFIITLFVSSPFLSDVDWIFSIWLSNVPNYAVIFVKLMIIDALAEAFNAGVANVIFANGRIAFYQITTNTIGLLSVIVALFVLSIGVPVYYYLYVYIIFTLFRDIFAQISLNRVEGFGFKLLLWKSYIPSFLVAAFYFPILLVPMNVHPIIHIVTVLIYLIVVIILFGMNSTERLFVKNIIKKYYYKIKIY